VKAAYSKEQIFQAMAKAQSNLVTYRRAMLNNGTDETMPAEFHYTWSDLLLKGKDHTAIQGYRESAKTQYVLRSFPLYALTFPSRDRDYIVLIKKNSTLASNKLKEIEEEYTSNPLISANCKEIKQQSGDVFSVDVANQAGEIINVRIEAYGKGASIRGLANIDRRPKIVIIDDPQDVEDAESETVSETDWNWFLSDVIFLGQKTRIFLIGNNLGEKCIVERVFAMESSMERIKFKTMRLPVLTPQGEPQWPQKETKESILAEKADFSRLGKLEIWLREKMCEATSEETRCFHDQDYRYYLRNNVMDDLSSYRVWATLDPASSKNKSACYRALMINAVDTKNNWFLIDCAFGRWDSMELIDIMFQKVEQYDLRSIGIEKGEYKQIIEPFILEEMKKRNIMFNILPLEHAKVGSKLERIKMLQPRFRSHSIWFPDTNADWIVELKSELGGVTNTAIKSLFIDLADALAMQEQIAERPVRSTSDLHRFRQTV